METVDHAELASWMDLDAEGLLGGAEKTRLGEYLERVRTRSDAQARGLEAERACWSRLHRALTEDHTEVRASFADDVMAAVDLEVWQKSSSQAWRLPLAMMLVFALGAAWSLAGVGVDHPVIGTGSAIADFMQTTALAGAGVAVATWRGAGMGLEEMLAGSPLNLAALAMLVLCVNLLFVSLMRRRHRPAAEKAGKDVGSSDSSSGEMSHFS